MIALTAADWINISVSLGTWAAVVVVVILHLRQQREVTDEAKKKRVRLLVSYHCHMVICARRIREYWENMAHAGAIPSFRLVEISYDSALDVAPTLFANFDPVSVFLKAIEEHAHLNAKWDDAVQASVESDEHADADPEEYDYYVQVAQDTVESLNAAAPVVYSLTRDLLKRIEEECTQHDPSAAKLLASQTAPMSMNLGPLRALETRKAMSTH